MGYMEMDLIIICPKPYSIYLRGTVQFGLVGLGLGFTLGLRVSRSNFDFSAYA